MVHSTSMVPDLQFASLSPATWLVYLKPPAISVVAGWTLWLARTLQVFLWA
jgi:hypothetical protein